MHTHVREVALGGKGRVEWRSDRADQRLCLGAVAAAMVPGIHFHLPVCGRGEPLALAALSASPSETIAPKTYSAGWAGATADWSTNEVTRTQLGRYLDASRTDLWRAKFKAYTPTVGTSSHAPAALASAAERLTTDESRKHPSPAER